MSTTHQTCDIACIDDALEALGASAGTLTEAERTALDRDGYVIFRDLIDAAWLDELRATYDALAKAEGAAAGHDYQQEAGAHRMGNLPNKGAAFDRVWTHPRYLAAVHHIIGGEFALDSLSSREPLPGWAGRQQGLHLDGALDDGTCGVVDSTWMLDDFTAENGATRLVPGSHRWAKAPWDVMDCQDDHPQQIIVEAPAGSVLVFNGLIWHSGRLNRAGTRRRGLFPYMRARARWDGGAYQRKHLLKSTWDRLSPAQRYILGV
jgi:ectoine hydroxylase-related dioxygenase (phytanoyl-CoA dioxygenase family)